MKDTMRKLMLGIEKGKCRSRLKLSIQPALKSKV